MHYLWIRRRTVTCCSLFLLYAILAVSYRMAFEPEPGSDRTPDDRFSRVVVWDTILYEDIGTVLNDRGVDPEIFVALTLRNFWAPSFFALLLSKVTWGDLLLNIALVGLASMLLLKILTALAIPSLLPLVLFLLNPETVFYSQGFLKEIPCLVLTTAFVYAWLKGRYGMAFMAAIVVTTIRYHVGLLFLLVLAFAMVPARLKLKCLHLALFGLFTALPALYHGVLSGAVEGYYKYRDISGMGFGVGAGLSELLFNVPLAGYLAVPMRVLQVMVEPFPAIVLFEEDGALNVTYCILSGSMLLMTVFYLAFLGHSLQVLRGAYQEYFVQPIAKVFLVVSAYLLMTGVNTFVSHRFMYAIIPLLPVVVLAHHRQGSSSLAYIVIASGMLSFYSVMLSGYLLRH